MEHLDNNAILAVYLLANGAIVVALAIAHGLGQGDGQHLSQTYDPDLAEETAGYRRGLEISVDRIVSVPTAVYPGRRGAGGVGTGGRGSIGPNVGRSDRGSGFRRSNESSDGSPLPG
jgi:hypothetical protein